MARSKFLDDRINDVAQRHRAIHHLREILGLKKSEFEIMKKTFSKITRSRFDLEIVGSLQNEALNMAIEDLKSQHPAWFKQGDINVETLVRRTFFITHASRRKKSSITRKTTKENRKTAKEDTKNYSQKNKKLETPSKPGPSLTQRMAANLLSIKNGSRAPKIFASPPRALRNAKSSNDPIIRTPLSDIPASSGPPAYPQRPPVPPPQTPDTNPDASFPLSSISELGVSHVQIPSSSLERHDSSHISRSSRAIKAETTSFSIPTTFSSNMVASSSTSASCGDAQKCSAVPPQYEAQICSIHNFLGAVVPPMTHLLHQFIEFGCLGDEFLFAISMWPPEEIRTLLTSLPPGPGGSGLTKMEIEILTYHFESYFLASKPEV